MCTGPNTMFRIYIYLIKIGGAMTEVRKMYYQHHTANTAHFDRDFPHFWVVLGSSVEII